MKVCHCRKCGCKLVVGENCYQSWIDIRNYICTTCRNIYNVERRARREYIPIRENRSCSSFLGVHVAERVLRYVFNDVEVMPMNNHGYDIICNRGKLIDSKAACMTMSCGSLGRWQFCIGMNKIADYFVLMAFDNREDTNPLYCWMIPGNVLNHLHKASISVTTIHKWDEYKLDITKISACCNSLKSPL